MAKRLTVSVQQPQRRLIGYARVSTDGQIHHAQIDELRAAGCDRIYQKHGSGASRARPVLIKLLGELTAGDILVVVRLDRLASREPSIGSDRGSSRARCAFPLDPRSDRYIDASGHVLPPSSRRGRPTRAGANCRTHQSRHQGGEGAWQAPGKPGLARTATGGHQISLKSTRKALSRRAHCIRANLAADGAATAASPQLGQRRAGA